MAMYLGKWWRPLSGGWFELALYRNSRLHSHGCMLFGT